MTNEQIGGMLHMMMQNAESEAKTTAKILAAVPDDKMSFTLGDKGRSTLELSRHLAATDIWFLDSLLRKSFNEQADETAAGSTSKDIAAWYSSNFADKAAKVKALPIEHLAEPIDFFGMVKMPAVMYLGFLANHMIHHRGQLSTYLRAMNAHVPQIYGPSADEPMPGM